MHAIFRKNIFSDVSISSSSNTWIEYDCAFLQPSDDGAFHTGSGDACNFLLMLLFSSSSSTWCEIDCAFLQAPGFRACTLGLIMHVIFLSFM